MLYYDKNCHFWRNSESEAIKLLQNIDLTEKSGTLQKSKYQEQFWSYKFTKNSNLNKKVESYKLKKIKF